MVGGEARIERKETERDGGWFAVFIYIRLVWEPNFLKHHSGVCILKGVSLLQR